MASVRRSQGNSMSVCLHWQSVRRNQPNSSQPTRPFEARPAPAPLSGWVKPACRGQPGPCGKTFLVTFSSLFVVSNSSRVRIFGLHGDSFLQSRRRSSQPTGVLFVANIRFFPKYAGTALFERKLPRWLKKAACTAPEPSTPVASGRGTLWCRQTRVRRDNAAT